MSPSVSVSPEVPEPDVIAEVVEDESEAGGPRGHPARGGAEEAVLDVHRVTLALAPGGQTVELQDIAVIGDGLVYLNLVKNILRQTFGVNRVYNLVTSLTNDVNNFQLNSVHPLLHFSFQFCQKSPEFGLQAFHIIYKNFWRGTYTPYFLCDNPPCCL